MSSTNCTVSLNPEATSPSKSAKSTAARPNWRKPSCPVASPPGWSHCSWLSTISSSPKPPTAGAWTTWPKAPTPTASCSSGGNHDAESLSLHRFQSITDYALVAFEQIPRALLPDARLIGEQPTERHAPTKLGSSESPPDVEYRSR